MTSVKKEVKQTYPICLENEIEKWHLRQSAKTVPPFKTGKVQTWREMVGSIR